MSVVLKGGAGKLRHRVRIQRPVGTRDDYGEPAHANADWETVTTAWAAIEPLSGRELWQARQAQARGDIRVRLRHSADVAGVDSTHRVLFGARALNIDHVLNLGERDREVHLLCVEAPAVAGVDAVAVVNVTSPDPDGTYVVGETITITVEFDGVVVVTGTPRILLNVVPTRYATYVSGSGTTTLSFEYTVQPGDEIPDTGMGEAHVFVPGMFHPAAFPWR